MPASNAKIAGLLREYSAMLALEGADRFKIKAYRRAAETLELMHTDIATAVARGDDLQELPGIGKALSGVIQEILATGQMSQLDRAVSRVPPEIRELAARPRLDVKTIRRIYKKLKIGSLDELQRRLDAGEIGATFGSRLEYHVRQGLDDRPRWLLSTAERWAINIESFLTAVSGVTRVSRTGSLRRKQDTVGDLKFLLCGSSASDIFDRFSQYGGIEASQRHSPREASFRLSNDLQIRLLWTPGEQWGLSWLLSTGSHKHIADLQSRASKRRLTLSKTSLQAKGINIAEEAEIYRGLGLAYIEPELREGRGEVQAALHDSLPQLVNVADLKGDLHMHTDASDGANTLAEMARAAQRRGYEYIAITDHSQSLKIANGLSEKRLREQICRIDKVNSRLTGLVVLKSAEVDILQDGGLDYPDDLLSELDLTICSIHSRFALNKQQQTDRLLRAMDNPHFNILGHATGRLLLKREGYEFDADKVFRHALANGCFFEINSSPDRLDLSDEHAKMAKDAGIKIAINTDAHSVGELDLISKGVNEARRAWLGPADVLNTLSWKKLNKLLAR